MRCAAIVVAGGSGRRFGGLKQFATLAGETVAARSIAACRSVAEHVVLVVPEGRHLERHGADTVVIGGDTRSASVRAGLRAIDDGIEVIVVHDGARPLASERLFFTVVAELADESVDAAIPGIDVTDTIKQVAGQGERRPVVATLERSSLVAVQTPQAFRASALRQAHRSEPDATDDAALIERQGGVVVVVPGEEANVKLTSPGDLHEAERLLEDVS